MIWEASCAAPGAALALAGEVLVVAEPVGPAGQLRLLRRSDGAELSKGN